MVLTMLIKLKRILIGLAYYILVGYVAAAKTQPVTTMRLGVILPEFAFAVFQLQWRTQVPLLLPTKVPITPFYPYVIPVTITPTQYLISLGTVPDCQAIAACEFGVIEGEKLTRETLTVQESYSYATNTKLTSGDRRSSEKPGIVSLAKGTKGYFVPFVCFSRKCRDSKIMWEQGGYRYTIAIFKGKKQTLIDMANSAIESK